jgi:hypothetical protein
MQEKIHGKKSIAKIDKIIKKQTVLSCQAYKLYCRSEKCPKKQEHNNGKQGKCSKNE